MILDRVVRKEGLYHPIPKPCKTAKFFNPLNVFPMSPVFVTTPFLVQKALKTANSEKCVFSCQTSKVVPEPPSSLVFRRKPAPRVCRAPNSVFCPEKLANSSPLNSSPLVTALSPLAFWVQKSAKPGPVPELLFRRVSRGPTARRGPGSMSDSPPRWSVSPPSLSPLMSPLLRLRFLVQKALQTVESEESVFRVGLQVGCPSLQIRRFSVESGLQTTTLLSFPLSGRKSGEFQPAERVTACHRRCHRSLTRQPAELVTTDAAPSGSVFWCKTVESGVGLQVGSLQIRRFSMESGLQTTTLLSFPLSGRKSGEFQAAEHVTACHRLSPLRHRSLWGAASMGLSNPGCSCQ